MTPTSRNPRQVKDTGKTYKLALLGGMFFEGKAHL